MPKDHDSGIMSVFAIILMCLLLYLINSAISSDLILEIDLCTYIDLYTCRYISLIFRSKRVVEAGQEDKIVDDCDLISALLHLLPHLLPTVNTDMSPAKVAERNRKVN
jgi:hypothetical protein